MKIKITILSLMLFVTSIGHAGQPEVRQTENLQIIGAEARMRNVPVLLLFSASHCPYCELLEDEILKPMLKSGEYKDKVLIAKIMLDEGGQINDFTGKTVSAGNLAVHYDAYVTPTMLFLSPTGQELSPRILGINTIEMFGGRVDHAIDVALKKMRSDAGKLASNIGSSTGTSAQRLQ